MATAVLIVEDQLLIAWHLREIVEDAGLEVLAIARDPQEAYAAAAQQRPDLALMDIRLHSGTSGVEAARELFERWGVRSIFLSANLDEATRAQVQPYRPLSFLGKPFLPGEVLTALRHAIAEIAGRAAAR